MNDQGKHRKRCYVVVHGRKPGIYTSWFGADGAYVQVHQFPGALYKGFMGRKEAIEYATLQRVTGKALVSSVPGEKNSSSHARQRTASEILIYTDGGCIRNPGPGGYGVVIIADGIRKEYAGGFRLTTNNRMELMACIVGLETLPCSTQKVQVYSDSRYVVDALEKRWAFRWRKNNWMRDRNNPAENADLWSRLLELYEIHEVTFHWVKGHSGHKENERCDALAKQASLNADLPPDRAYEQGRTQISHGLLFGE